MESVIGENGMQEEAPKMPNEAEVTGEEVMPEPEEMDGGKTMPEPDSTSTEMKMPGESGIGESVNMESNLKTSDSTQRSAKGEETSNEIALEIVIRIPNGIKISKSS